MPTLIIFIYDKRLEHLDHQMNARKSYVDNAQQPPMEGMISRQRRHADVCQVKPLTVPINTRIIRQIIQNIAQKKFNVRIEHPQSFNIGTCGGICDSRIPTNSPSNHAPMLDLMLKAGIVTGNYKACCVPVKYRSLIVWASGHGATTSFEIDDMLVDRCECLDIKA